ncbi:hypothetical protein [Streptomyces sp. SP18CS02]|uniref:hypothetical protein n=1 Tax=Streptomyces sp. SP18CS02 TaxID=3002531 RepID=UPI002E7A9EF1|nr:hypothetical protein [Streptomyces sp. SP18CS02]MEE1751562.1 hypothetical protein [Streptomyces sp. SP18CS02]
MLVELLKIVRYPWSPWLATVRTSFGQTVVSWGGDPAARPGEYRVEWKVAEDIEWGRNAVPAKGYGPEVRPGRHGIVLRGRLRLTGDGAGLFDLDDTTVLLNLVAPPPEGTVGTWVDLFVRRETVALHPVAH